MIEKGLLLTGAGTHSTLLADTLRQIGRLGYIAHYYPNWVLERGDGGRKEIALYRYLAWLMWAFWRRFVMGRMLTRLAQEVLGPQTPPLYVGFNGVHTDRLEVLLRVRPSLEQPVILLIANGPDGWRSHYKGMDIFFDTLVRVKARLPKIRALVVGEWTSEAQQQLCAQFPGAPVEFVGRRSDIEALLSEASLYLHLARGEAWGVAVLEAMAAGVPAIVSEWTGAAEVVAQVWPEGVVSLSPAEAAQRVLSYFFLPVAERHRLGEQSRTLIQQRYTHRHATRHFQALFVEACRREGWAVELPLIAEV